MLSKSLLQPQSGLFLLLMLCLSACLANSSGTASSGSVTSSSIQDGTITNDDLSDTADIEVAKLAAGSSGQVLATLASGAVAFQYAGAGIIRNAGFSVSLNANTLTVDLQTANLATPSASNPVSIAFRSSAATTGSYGLAEATSLVSLTIPQGATLGTISAVQAPIYIYAISNSGSIELAVSGKLFKDEGALVTTTALSTAADSGLLMYSTAARASVPFRLLGRLVSSQTTAGDWNIAPTQLTLSPFISATAESQNVVLQTPAFSNSWVDAGGAGAAVGYYRDNLSRTHLQGTMTAGTCGMAAFTLPAGLRPAGTVIFAVDSNGTYGSLSISAAGVVTPDAVACDNTAFSLDGVSFRATQ